VKGFSAPKLIAGHFSDAATDLPEPYTPRIRRVASCPLGTFLPFDAIIGQRFADYGHDGDDTIISLRLPRLADAAEDLYLQPEFWDTRPDADETAFEVFRHVVDDVAAENGESSRYDRQLLTRLARMKQVLGIQVQAIRLSETTTGTAVDRRIAATASRLGATTPASRQARIAGVLGMIRHSTCGFSIRLESGEEVHGVMESDEGLSMMPGLFGKPVLVLGSAIYRPSGRLLRIDAVGIEDGKDVPRLFAKIPQPQAPPAASSRPPEGLRNGQKRRSRIFRYLARRRIGRRYDPPREANPGRRGFGQLAWGFLTMRPGSPRRAGQGSVFHPIPAQFERPDLWADKK